MTLKEKLEAAIRSNQLLREQLAAQSKAFSEGPTILKSSLELDAKFAKTRLLSLCDGIESIVKRVRFDAEHDNHLNSLGELQGNAATFDNTVIELAILQRTLKP